MAYETPKSVTRSIKDEYVIGKMRRYIQEGKNELDEWASERKDGEAVWDGVFRGIPPDNSFYYPVVFSTLRHYIRSVRKTYMSAPEIVNVNPLGRNATDMEVAIAASQREEINYHIDRWNDFLVFLDDTSTAVVKTGVCFGKVWWERYTTIDEWEEEQPPQFEFVNGEATKIQQPNKIIRKETIEKQRLRFEPLQVEDVLYDARARKWSDVKWVIHQNIEMTEDELWDKVANDGWNADEVQALINSFNSEDEDIKEITRYKVAEFWGWMGLTDNEADQGPRRTTFVKTITDNDGRFLLKRPNEKDVYRYADGEPMIPIEAGYMVRREGQIRGESYCYRLRDYQGEINCIRNQRRRSVENDINERYAVTKNAEIEFRDLEDTGHGTLISVNSMDDFHEMRSNDNTVTSYAELATVRQDIKEMTGVTEYALGMVDPHMTDTLGGIQLMSTASNTVIYDNILSYNMFLENLMTKGLHLSLRYMTPQELESGGVEMPQGIERKEMLRNMRLSIDTGVGATSEMVELNNLTRAYFIVQQFIEYCETNGVEPGEARYYPAVILNRMLPLLNVKDNDHFIPSPEQLEKNTTDMLEQVQQQQQQMEAAMAEQNEAGLGRAADAGLRAGQEQFADVGAL